MIASLSPDMFDAQCPSSVMPLRIGDKWTAMVVLCLEHGPRRFNELRIPLRRISPKVLSETLRAMERDGLVSRHAYDENLPRVEYSLAASTWPPAPTSSPSACAVRPGPPAHQRAGLA